MQNEPLTAEIFAIGDELLLGRIYDTNSFWLATQLALLGFSVRRITCLPDDEPTIIDAIQTAHEHGASLLVASGGLGPTPDDKTIEAVAQALGCQVHPDPATLEHYSRRRNTPIDQLPPSLNKMAAVPVCATVLGNPVGWAPAISAEYKGMQIIAMPGPPKEMQAIWEQLVRERLANMTGRRGANRRVRVNMYESEVSPLMQELVQKYPGTYVKALIALATPEIGLPIDIVCYSNSVEGSIETLRAVVDALAELVEAHGKVVYLD